MSDELHIPTESFLVAQGMSDGLPDLWIVNSAWSDLRPKQAFAWHLSIIVECKDITENRLPTQEEGQVLADLGDVFDQNLTRDLNAVRLGRITWNGTRQFLYRVRDPKAANAYLQTVIASKTQIREFDFRMEADPDWLLAERYLAIDQKFKG
jgi:hypothetical protein